jgi:16S rRNA processing protein RimM
VRGEVRLWVFTEDPTAIRSYGPLESEDAAQRFDIESMRPAKDHVVARFAGVADRSAAERLNRLRLFVPRERLPPTEDADTFYHADLIGLAAVDRAGTVIGAVKAVHNFGAGDVLEIAPSGGGKTLLLAFTQSAVPAVDIGAGRIVIDPPGDADEG